VPGPPFNRLGPYEVLAAIGAGGMGEVFRARDTRLDRVVAIKVLRSEVAADPDRLRRFELEARAASALNHPNILTIYEVGRDGPTAYIAMEWIEGVTLRTLLDRGRLPLRRLLDIIHQTSEGLAKAHAAGIVHRDLKPENVMVSDDGFVKILDFGLAKLAEGTQTSQTVTRTVGTDTGVVMGTVGYMSPEQASGLPLDHRSDQFALGLIAYEMATGKRPFARPTAAQTMAATIEVEPDPISTLNPDLPEHLATVVHRCLEKTAVDRYESTRDLARDLKQIAESQATRVPSGSTGARPVRGSRRLLAVGAIVVAIVAALAAAAWLWRRGSASPSVASSSPLVAVRPFRNLSPDDARSYFAAGMTEEIRGQLSKMSALRLLSRAAAEQYGDGDVARMAEQLSVDHVVEGSVRLDRDRARIAVELINARNQQTLWSEQYERELSDVFSVQSDVALRVATTLAANLTSDERRRVEQRPTSNAEAYQLYLRQNQLSIMDRGRNLEAIGLLRKALDLDPRFAAAKARLAYRTFFLGYYDDPKYVDEAISLARGAASIDPTLAAPHFALASAYSVKGLGDQARLSFLRALELDPNHTSSMNNLSIHESHFGRFDESLYWARRAWALSAKGANDYYHVSVPLVSLRDDELSEAWLRQGEQRFPAEPRIQIMLAAVELVQGRDAEALARARRAVQSSPTNEEPKHVLLDLAFLLRPKDVMPIVRAGFETAPDVPSDWLAHETMRTRYAILLKEGGQGVEATRLADEAAATARRQLDAGSQSPSLMIEVAAVHMIKDDPEAALDSLEEAYQKGFRAYDFVERDRVFAPLRDSPRFRQLVQQMQQDVAAMRQRARERGLMDLEKLD
jgi:serine/threonine protein kinase/Flp pilus assembly protein TadD